MVRAPLRQEISRLRATTEQKNLSPYPRAAPLEMTERQTAYHHFKPHGYRNTSKNGMRPFAAGDFSTQSHNRIQKHLSPYPRAAPLEMTERQAAFHHFKPHGYRNTSKNGTRPFASGDFSTQSHNRAKESIPISTCSSARNDRAADSLPSFQAPRI